MRFTKNDVITLLSGKRISNIFSYLDQNSIQKIYFLFNLKLNGKKVEFNTL